MCTTIIGLSGKLKSGKDLSAKYLKTALEDLGYTVEIVSIFKPFKDLCIELFNFTENQVYTQKGKEEYIEREKRTVREILIDVGSAFKNKFGDDFLINLTLDRIRDMDVDYCIIPDVRFLNEVTLIKESGGKVYRLLRSSKSTPSSISSSPSECSLDTFEGFDEIIDNRKITKDELMALLTNIAVKDSDGKQLSFCF